MNEILNVNLGGYPFTIDNDAYHEINRYLGAIQKHFADSDGCDEILDDIETRMAELFTEFLQGKAIISMKELEAVIKVMGRPEDFGAEAYDDDYDSDSTKTESKSFRDKYRHIKTGKRFYRDPEEKVIGGVCGGIAAYFGIENPMWIRLGFLALIALGIPIILYPILWIIVPEAKTASDKLKMRGEPATVSNIARTVEQELTELSDKITEMSKDLGSQKKNFRSNHFSPGKILSKGISVIGKVVLSIVRLLKTIIKPFFSLFLGIMLLALGAMWIGWLATSVSTFPFLNYLGPSPMLFSSLGGLAVFNTVAIPILGLMLVIIKWFSSYRIPQKWRTNLRIGWFASFVFALFTIFSTVMSFNHEAESTESVEYSSSNDVLNITSLDFPEHKAIGFYNSPFSNMTFTKAGLILGFTRVKIVKSETKDIIVETRISSQGKSYAQAKKLVDKVEVNHNLNGNTLELADEFIIKKGNKFRAQGVDYTIHIPEGKQIKIDKSLAHYVSSHGYFKDGIRPRKLADFTWTMTDEGLASEGWDKEYRAEKFLDVKSLKNLNIDGRLATTILYGDKNEVLLKGTKTAVDKVKKVETNGTTSLIVEGYIPNNVTLEIRTPNLEVLQAKGLSSLRIEGFKQKDMELNFSGERSMSDVKIYVDVENLTCNIGGSNDVVMLGSGKNVLINILRGSRITAEHYKAENVIVKGNIYSNSSFYASESFVCPPHESHSFTLYGVAEINKEKVANEKIVEASQEENTSNPQ